MFGLGSKDHWAHDPSADHTLVAEIDYQFGYQSTHFRGNADGLLHKKDKKMIPPDVHERTKAGSYCICVQSVAGLFKSIHA